MILLKGHSLIYFIVIGILIIFFLILVVLLIVMAFRIKNNLLNILWPISILKFCLPFLSYTFFGQYFIILSSIYKCNGEYSYISTSLKCKSGIWFAVLGPIIGVILFLHCLIALITNNLYFKRIFIKSKSDILQKTDSFPDNVFIITKIALNLLFILFKKNNDQWVILFFSILFTSLNAFYTLRYQNRVNHTLKILNNILSLILVSVFASLFIGKMFILFEFSGAIYLFFNFTIVIILFVIFYTKKEINFIDVDYKEIIEPVEYLNYIIKFFNIIINKKTSRNNCIILEGLLYKIEETCIIPDCPLKKYIDNLDIGIECPFLLKQFCGKLFEFGISKFNDNINLKINYAIFLISHMNYKSKSLMILNKIDKNISFQNNFWIYSVLKFSNKWNFSLVNTNNNINFNYRQNKIKLKTLIKKSTLLYYDFLLLLRNNNQRKENFKKMYRIGREIIKNNPKIDEIYEKLINVKTNNIEIIKLYNEFIEGILCDDEKLEKCQNNSKIALNSCIDIHEKDFANFDYEILNEKGNQPYIIISTQKEQLGKIIDISLNSLKIFGYSKYELIGQHINILIPKIFHKVHDLIIRDKIEKQRLKFFDDSNKRKIYFPNFIKKEIFGVSKMKFLIDLVVKVFFVKTEENKLNYIVIIENYYPLMFDLTDNNNNIQKYCILTDENFLIQSFTPNCMEFLDLNYSDINSNFNIINYIKQFQEDYLSLIDNMELSKTYVSKNEIFSEEKTETKNYKNSIPPYIKKKLKNELYSKKYSKKCKITWRINYDIDLKISKIHKRKGSTKTLEINDDYKKSNIFRQTKRENYFGIEKKVFMEIEKIIVNKEFIGYYFYFSQSKIKNYNNINYIYSKSEIKDINNHMIKLKKYQCTFKTKKSGNFDINNIDIKKDNMISSVIISRPNKISKEKKNIRTRRGSLDKIHRVNFKEENQNNSMKKSSINKGLNLNEYEISEEIIITGDYIPEYISHFVIDLKVSSFIKLSKEDKQKNYLDIIQNEANEKIQKYQEKLKLISKNTDDDSISYESEEESDESSDSSINNSLYSNIKNQSHKSNNILRRKENEYIIKKLSSKLNNKNITTRAPPTPTVSEKNIMNIIFNNNKSQKKLNILNNYYKVNLNNIRLYLYDYFKDQFVEIKEKEEGNKKEDKNIDEKEQLNSKIENILNSLKIIKPIDFEKDEWLSSLNIKYIKNPKKNENKENISNSVSIPIEINNKKDNVNKKKLIYEALNQNKDEPPIKKLKYFTIIFYFILIISGILCIIFDYEYISKINSTLSGVKYCSIIRYCNLISVYYLREMTLLNYKIYGLRGGEYTEFIGKIKYEYNQLIKEEILNLLIGSQKSLKAMYSLSFPIYNKSEENLNKIKTNIRISNTPRIDMKYNIYMTLMHYSGTLFNLATSTTSIEQDHPDLYYFIFNGLNGYKNGLESLIGIYKIELEIVLSNITLISLITCFNILALYCVIFFLTMKSFLNSNKTIGNYMEVFFGIDDNIIKSMINNCENFVNKIKSSEEKKNFEKETVDESAEEKIDMNKNTKNKKRFSYNSNLNYGIKKKISNKASKTTIFFIAIYGLFNLLSYSYYIYNWIYLFNISKESINIYTFWIKMQTHHLSIVEYFNAYREYLFDNESTINNMNSLDFLKKFDKENLLNMREDAKFITSNIIRLAPETIIFFKKTLCSYYINDYFDSSYECEEKVGLISKYNFDYLTFYFVEEIKIAINILKYKLETEKILGNLTNYNYNEYYNLIPTLEKDYTSIFRLDLFNNEDIHKKMNLIFFSIILPYIKKNSEVLFNKLNEESGEITLIIYNILFYVLVTFIYLFYFIPIINNINTNIYKTKNMLSIIPLNILSSQCDILKLLNIYHEK